MRHDTAVRVGTGGMGEVFKAWDPDLERWVALKYLRHDDPELVQRLFREARAQARISHPGVCEVYEVGEEGGRPYIAMQFVDGRLLTDAAHGLPLERKVRLIKQVAEAVQAAHGEGLIHRDLKPGNIMVSETADGDLRPYVLDFGIAASRRSRASPSPVRCWGPLDTSRRSRPGARTAPSTDAATSSASA
jgi:serine/threonine protein kinase